jgi:hypothetical protein
MVRKPISEGDLNTIYTEVFMVVKIHAVVSCMWEPYQYFSHAAPFPPLQTLTWCQNLDDHNMDLSTNFFKISTYCWQSSQCYHLQ